MPHLVRSSRSSVRPFGCRSTVPKPDNVRLLRQRHDGEPNRAHLVQPPHQLSQSLVRDETASGHLGTSQTGPVPSTLRHTWHVVEAGNRDRVDGEELQDLLEDLVGEVRWESLRDAGHTLRGRVPHNSVLVAEGFQEILQHNLNFLRSFEIVVFLINLGTGSTIERPSCR